MLKEGAQAENVCGGRLNGMLTDESESHGEIEDLICQFYR